ncbi:hypothetical protein H0X10_01790 [Candidatus Saccharibacteria bacterium]|nr:hypothetical protein [Candidatus Saccharibacteria bacterium]
MAEKQDFHIQDQIAQDVEAFALNQGLETDYAAEILLTLGSYVVSNLSDGREFLLKTGKQLNYVEWNLPESESPPTSSKPPTLRIVK